MLQNARGDPPRLPSKVQPKRELTLAGRFAAASNLYSATGDFNGDGIDDFVSKPRFGTSIVLRIGRSNNIFEPDRLIAVGGAPRTVIAADLNKDGFPDFVVGHFGEISIVTATGASSYAAARELPAGGRVESLFQADFNNDQLPDIAGILHDGKAVVVFLNSGNGNLASPIRLALPEDGRFLVAGDINGDGRADLILTSNEQSTRPSLMTLLNNGNGGFGAVQSSPIPDTPAYLAVTDTNGDNRLDAIVRLGNGLTSIHAGSGTGLFTRRSVHGGGYGFTTGFDILELDDANRFKVDGTMASVAAVGFPGFARLARVADLNGDSQPDFLAAGDGTFGRTGGLWVRLRSGQDYAPVATLGSIKPSAIEVIDINGDSRPDIVALDSTRCSVLMNTGNDSTNYRLLAGDFNNDKRGDIVVVGASSMQALVNNGNGGFRPAVSLAVPNGVLNAILGDVNGDGLMDILAMTGTAVSVRNGRKPVLVQYLAQADGNFRPATETLTVNASETSSVLAVVDLNNDKIPDVVYGLVPALSAAIWNRHPQPGCAESGDGGNWRG